MTRRDERGAGTVLVVALAGVVLLVGCAVGVVTAMVAAHRRAQSAADLAALAGAAALARGAPACAGAATIARADGARIESCVVDGRDVSVIVVVTGPRWLGQRADLRARARAGPEPSGTGTGTDDGAGTVDARAAPARPRSVGVGQEHVEQGDRGPLVERVVLVAALG